MGGWAYVWGVKTVVQKEESSVCLSGNSNRRQPQHACVGGGGSFVWAPPQSAPCPIVKALGVNCNCEVPSQNLSETTFGNALTLYALALHTSTQLALSCSPNSALLPVFHLFRLLAAHFHWLVRGRKSRGTEFARDETTGRFQGLFGWGFLFVFVTLVPSRAPSLHHGRWQKFCLAWCENKTPLGRKGLTLCAFGASVAQDKANQICPNGFLRETWAWSLADFWRSGCHAQARSSKCTPAGGERHHEQGHGSTERVFSEPNFSDVTVQKSHAGRGGPGGLHQRRHLPLLTDAGIQATPRV